MVFSSMDLGRAYLFYFNDSNVHSLHASSGITRDYRPKPACHAMRHVFETLGDYRFARAIGKKDHYLYV
jgi:hypothetical protein